MTGKAAFSCNDDPDVLIEKIKKCKYDVPLYLSADCRDMLSKLIVAEPKGRIKLHSLKKHPFFNKIDWKAAEEGKLKPPTPDLRPI